MKKHYVASTRQIKATKWRYQLETGPALRLAIEDDDYAGVVNALYDVYQELLDNGFIDEDDYEQYTVDFDMYEDYDDYDDLAEAINYELSNLYDLCDNLNIWIPLQ